MLTRLAIMRWHGNLDPLVFFLTVTGRVRGDEGAEAGHLEPGLRSPTCQERPQGATGEEEALQAEGPL